MKSQVALLLLGYVVYASAAGYANLIRKPPAQLPVPSNYAPPPQAPPAAAPPSAAYDEPIRTPVTEEPQVVYKAPVRIYNKQPIRVSASNYGEEEEIHHPLRQRGNYGGAGAPGGSHLKVQEQEDLDEEYASNAQYSFASAIDDGIQDQSQHREETRDGKKVTGSYSYSDGYYMRTVQYEADENGYRVVGGSVEPIRETGPEVDLLHGKAEVLTQLHGVDTQYSVTADELAKANKRHKNAQYDGQDGHKGAY